MPRDRVIYGFHAVEARIRHRPGSVREIIVDSGRHDSRLARLNRTAERSGVMVRALDGKRLGELAGTQRHQGVVAVVEANAPLQSFEQVLTATNETALFLVLDGVTDPHNLGACLRVADAFGAHAIVAPKDRAVGITATVEKVASGAADTVPYIAVTNLARELKEMNKQGVWTIGTSHNSQTAVDQCDLRRPVALVLGAEGKGMRRLTEQTCDETIRIPMSGTVESLNVSVAAGICLFEARRQRRGVKVG